MQLFVSAYMKKYRSACNGFFFEELRWYEIRRYKLNKLIAALFYTVIIMHLIMADILTIRSYQSTIGCHFQDVLIFIISFLNLKFEKLPDSVGLTIEEFGKSLYHPVTGPFVKSSELS